MPTRISEVPADWQEITKGYQTPSTLRSILELALTLAGFVAAVVAMHWSLKFPYGFTLLLSVVAALFLVRLFSIKHDCGHQAFFASRKMNDWVGRFLGLLTWTPYRQWKRAHWVHHKTSGDLSRRGKGDVWTRTVKEYRGSSRWWRAWYRIYRNPVFLFLIGAPFNFLVIHRTRFSSLAKTREDVRSERVSVWGTNLALLVFATVMARLLGLREYLSLQIPLFCISTVMGVWLFYVQHQFEHTYWRRSEEKEWDYVDACLRGSSFYKLPAWLAWFTAYIGIHHVHHLNARIPFYRLRKAYEENPWLQKSPTLTLRTSLKSLSLRLWDEERGRMVGFGEIK